MERQNYLEHRRVVAPARAMTAATHRAPHDRPAVQKLAERYLKEHVSTKRQRIGRGTRI
jgi:hypothetical protein